MQFTILTLILFMNLMNKYVAATGIALGYMLIPVIPESNSKPCNGLETVVT